MNAETEKLNIINTIIESFREEGVAIDPSEIKTLETNDLWSVWVEQPHGLDTSSDKFCIPLSHLEDGVNYSLAVGNHVKVWVHPMNGYFKEEIPKHLLDNERLELFKEEWVGKMVRLPQQGEGPVLDADHRGMLTVAVSGPNMVTAKQIHYTKVRKL
jgi:hypothetical protein